MIHDLISACNCGFDLLVIFLAWQGYSLAEIAQKTGESKTSVFRRLQRIKQSLGF